MRLDGKGIKPGSIPADRFASGFLSALGIVSWGDAGAEAADKIEVTLQLQDLAAENLAKVERIRLTCTSTSTMALAGGGNGTVISGTGTADMVIETDETTGTFDLEVTEAGAKTVTVESGATQGSGFVGCRESVDLVFA